MKSTTYVSIPWLLLLCCSLAALLAACGPFDTGNQGNTPTPTLTTQGTHSTPTPLSSTPTTQGTSQPPSQSSTQPMPQTDTSCPSANSGRAAVMRNLQLGKDQNLVYLYQTVNQTTPHTTSSLDRYDVQTKKIATIYSTSTTQIQQAQISQDGEWVLFLTDNFPIGQTSSNGIAMIQMIRMDGQGLQTLYCFPNNAPFSGVSQSNLMSPINLQWSFDEKSLLFSADFNGNTSIIYYLDLTSGYVRTEVLDQNDPLYQATILTWLDNSNAVIAYGGRTNPQPPAKYYILNVLQTVSSADVNQTLQFSGGGRMHDFSLDTSFDGKKLYTADCVLAGSPFSTTLSVSQVNSGKLTTIYTPGSTICVENLRVISPNTLLLLVRTFNPNTNATSEQVWTLQTDGSHQQILTTFTWPSGQSDTFTFNRYAQYTWSNVSRDNSYYALEQDGTFVNILIGPLGGGSPIQIVSANQTQLSVVGWTTM